MTTQRLLQRVDELVEMGNAVLRTRRAVNRHQELVDEGVMAGFRSASLSFIKMLYDQQHPHYVEFSDKTRSLFPRNVEGGLAVLRAIRGEIAGGWLSTVKGLLTAEVFTDYIEMAEYLLEANYKDPAAVIAGSTLEAHLRQLCKKNGIPVARPKNGKDVPLKADVLNSTLAKAAVYDKADQKQVTAWLDLRNKAAHGEYTAYTREQIELVVSGVIDFIARNAA